MKTIHIFLEDAEYNEVKKEKGKLTWKQFLLGIGGKQNGRRTGTSKSKA